MYLIRSGIQHMCLPGGSNGKESACNVGDLGSTDPWAGKNPLEEGMATLA